MLIILIVRPHRNMFTPSAFPRLAVILLLQSAFERLVVFLAPPCSTWVAINCGTSRRTILCPAGDESLLQNRKSNKLATRTGFFFKDIPKPKNLNHSFPFVNHDILWGYPVLFGEAKSHWPWRLGLILLLVTCMDAHFIIEQPGSSLFFHYPYIVEAFKLMKLAGVKVVEGANSRVDSHLLLYQFLSYQEGNYLKCSFWMVLEGPKDYNINTN